MIGGLSTWPGDRSVPVVGIGGARRGRGSHRPGGLHDPPTVADALPLGVPGGGIGDIAVEGLAAIGHLSCAVGAVDGAEPRRYAFAYPDRAAGDGQRGLGLGAGAVAVTGVEPVVSEAVERAAAVIDEDIAQPRVLPHLHPGRTRSGRGGGLCPSRSGRRSSQGRRRSIDTRAIVIITAPCRGEPHHHQCPQGQCKRPHRYRFLSTESAFDTPERRGRMRGDGRMTAFRSEGVQQPCR